MKSSSVRRLLWILVGAASVAIVFALPSTAADHPPNLNLRAVGPVDFACVQGQLPNCTGDLSLRITGTAAASGAHIGGKSTFSTVEISTPDFTAFPPINHIDGHSTVTARN